MVLLRYHVVAAVLDQGCVTSAEQVAEEPMPSVEPGGVPAPESLHSGDQFAARGFDDQAKMLEHQAERMHLPAGLFPVLAQASQETASVAAIHDVGEGSRTLDLQPARRLGPDLGCHSDCQLAGLTALLDGTSIRQGLAITG